MFEIQIDVLAIVMQSVIGCISTGTLGYLVKFARDQRKVNRANAMANRSMQRDVLYRYFSKVVERGETITPDEYKHISDCYDAYHENGGNGAGTLMWERIRECVKIDTGRN